MKRSEATEPSHLLARVGSHLIQSVAFVDVDDAPGNHQEYRNITPNP